MTQLKLKPSNAIQNRLHRNVVTSNSQQKKIVHQKKNKKKDICSTFIYVLFQSKFIFIGSGQCTCVNTGNPAFARIRVKAFRAPAAEFVAWDRSGGLARPFDVFISRAFKALDSSGRDSFVSDRTFQYSRASGAFVRATTPSLLRRSSQHALCQRADIGR